MQNETNRRIFLRTLGLVTVGSALIPGMAASCARKSGEQDSSTLSTSSDMFFKISLAEWSLHKMLNANELTNLDFPSFAKNEFDISAIEYVNQFFKDKAQDQEYLRELKTRCSDLGTTSLLIMVDNEGNLGDTDKGKRSTAVDNHKKWVEAAQFLGCHSIRVNAAGSGSREEVAAAASEGLRTLSEFAIDYGINVIVENHGGYSSDGQWLASVIADTGMNNCGTLPDFGNFCIQRERKPEGGSICVEAYDRYKGVEELMPYAKGVSAKSYDFDENGNCIETDYEKMLAIVKASGYIGYIGIEYEGSTLSEVDGIKATKALLERVGASIA